MTWQLKKYVILIALASGFLYFIEYSEITHASLTAKRRNFSLALKGSVTHQVAGGLVTNVSHYDSATSLAGNAFALVMCEGKSRESRDVRNRQQRQVLTLIKSAVALTGTVLRFLLLTDTERVFRKIENATSLWPSSFRSRLLLERRDVWFPAKKYQTFHILCTLQSLFLPDLLTDLDAVVYLDTDQVFMRPPEDVWSHFHNFSESQMVGAAPLKWYYTQPNMDFPYYGSTGLNAGLLMMNLTRMRATQGGWTRSIVAVIEAFKGRMIGGDQPVHNIYYSEFPDKVYELGCDWNYVSQHCTRNLCPEAEAGGVSLLHGASMHFFWDNVPSVKAVYESWENYRPGNPLEAMVTSLITHLKKLSHNKSPELWCSDISNMTEILTLQLRKSVLLDQKYK